MKVANTGIQSLVSGALDNCFLLGIYSIRVVNNFSMEFIARLFM